MQSPIAKFYELPQMKRNPDQAINFEQSRYKSVDFWMSILERFGPDVFFLRKLDKTTKYGQYYEFAAKFTYESVEHTIPVNIEAKNFVLGRASARKPTPDTSGDASFIIYKSHQTKEQGKRMFDLFHILSCIQYSLIYKLQPNNQNQLVFPYCPLSTSSKVTVPTPYKEPLIKFCLTLDKANATTQSGVYDLNTKFVKYQFTGKGRSNGFVPSHLEISADSIQGELTQGTIITSSDIDLSNVHLPNKMFNGYVSFKATVRQMAFVKNEIPSVKFNDISDDSDIFNELIKLTSEPVSLPNNKRVSADYDHVEIDDKVIEAALIEFARDTL